MDLATILSELEKTMRELPARIDALEKRVWALETNKAPIPEMQEIKSLVQKDGSINKPTGITPQINRKAPDLPEIPASDLKKHMIDWNESSSFNRTTEVK